MTINSKTCEEIQQVEEFQTYYIGDVVDDDDDDDDYYYEKPLDALNSLKNQIKENINKKFKEYSNSSKLNPELHNFLLEFLMSLTIESWPVLQSQIELPKFENVNLNCINLYWDVPSTSMNFEIRNGHILIHQNIAIEREKTIAKELGAKFAPMFYSSKINQKSLGFHPLKKLIKQTPQYLEYLKNNVNFTQFQKLFNESIFKSIENLGLNPLSIEFDIFVIPNEDSKFPSAGIILSQDDSKNRITIRKKIAEDLRLFLLERAASEQSYVDLRNFQRLLKIYVRWGDTNECRGIL
jgi:hypothetical protein